MQGNWQQPANIRTFERIIKIQDVLAVDRLKQQNQFLRRQITELTSNRKQGHPKMVGPKVLLENKPLLFIPQHQPNYTHYIQKQGNHQIIQPQFQQPKVVYPNFNEVTIPYKVPQNQITVVSQIRNEQNNLNFQQIANIQRRLQNHISRLQPSASNNIHQNIQQSNDAQQIYRHKIAQLKRKRDTSRDNQNVNMSKISSPSPKQMIKVSTKSVQKRQSNHHSISNSKIKDTKLQKNNQKVKITEPQIEQNDFVSQKKSSKLNKSGIKSGQRLALSSQSSRKSLNKRERSKSKQDLVKIQNIQDLTQGSLPPKKRKSINLQKLPTQLSQNSEKFVKSTNHSHEKSQKSIKRSPVQIAVSPHKKQVPKDQAPSNKQITVQDGSKPLPNKKSHVPYQAYNFLREQSLMGTPSFGHKLNSTEQKEVTLLEESVVISNFSMKKAWKTNQQNKVERSSRVPSEVQSQTSRRSPIKIVKAVQSPRSNTDSTAPISSSPKLVIKIPKIPVSKRSPSKYQQMKIDSSSNMDLSIRSPTSSQLSRDKYQRDHYLS